ncbi:MAG: TIGR02281 family clan AA aspartic protease [Myxococcota bacterium]
MPLAARVLTVLFLALAGAASAEIYRWTDEADVVHFSQSLEGVPPQHRESARASASADRSLALQTFSLPAAAAHTSRARPGRTISIPFERRGNVMQVDVLLNDRLTVPFLVDTGASDVTISREVADRLGLHVGPETPHVYAATANGIVRVAVVQLDSVQLGPARVEGLQAIISPAISVGLLGGNFFNNFIYRVDAAQRVITLEPNDAMRAGLGEREWRERFRRIREPLARLGTHLEERQISRAGRREELERNLAALKRQLKELDLTASRAGVPVAWRH